MGGLATTNLDGKDDPHIHIFLQFRALVDAPTTQSGMADGRWPAVSDRVTTQSGMADGLQSVTELQHRVGWLVACS